MSFETIKAVADASKKAAVVDVRSGDSVRVYQKIKEGNKFRSQRFDGVVIRVDKKNSVQARIVVRKISLGVGVEKSFLLHSPLVEKIEIVRRAKVRRNNLRFLRERTGKATRLTGKDFDREKANTLEIPETPAEEVTPEMEAEAVSKTDDTPEAKAEEVVEAESKTAEVEAEKADSPREDEEEPEE